MRGGLPGPGSSAREMARTSQAFTESPAAAASASTLALSGPDSRRVILVMSSEASPASAPAGSSAGSPGVVLTTNSGSLPDSRTSMTVPSRRVVISAAAADRTSSKVSRKDEYSESDHTTAVLDDSSPSNQVTVHGSRCLLSVYDEMVMACS